MNHSEIIQLIEIHGEAIRFVGKADNLRVDFVERVLGVSLPESYKWFLTNFGLAILPGCLILGNGLDTIPACVRSTKDWREFGLPNNLVVIEDSGTDWVFCLDTSMMEHGECPVVDWEQNNTGTRVKYETFLKYFKERLQESLDWTP